MAEVGSISGAPTLPATSASQDALETTDLASGDLIDRYRINALLGAGGMGVVYRAHDGRLGRDVAIKVLRSDAAVGSDACRELCRRLLREARAMARLSHPNIVTVHDVATFRGRVYLVMEYVDGGTLRAWASAGARSWSERLSMLLDAGRGLAEAHAAGVIHRDFKPDNVLVSASGRVQVGDFGLALDSPRVDSSRPAQRENCHGSDAAHITGSGTIVGTPAYMAPEQHRGEPTDGRTDLFAFAVSTWEILFGRLPFPGRTALDLLHGIENGDLIEPPASTDAPAPLAQVLARALASSPEDRHASIPDLLDELERAGRKPRGLLARLFRRR